MDKEFIENPIEAYEQLKAENEELKKSVLKQCPNCGEEYLNPKGAELYNENVQLKAENLGFKILHESDKDLLKRKEQECEELKEFQKLLKEQMEFNKSELELSLSSKIKRSEFLLKEFKKADKQRDDWREKAVQLKQALTEIKQLLEDALDVDKTDAEQSFDNFYKAIKLCEVLDD